MAGSDNILFNTREKPLSSDWNNIQSMQARTLLSLLRHWTMGRLSGLGAGSDSETIYPITNGLQVIPNGSNVHVEPGFLLQDSAALAPTPGTLDSDYRVALNLGNLAVTAPSPVGNVFYLLEAQMAEVTATESRDILNASTGDFVSTVVTKTVERQLATQWVAGSATNYPAPTGGDWVVLAGVFRPAGGGAVLDSHIQDMRIQPDLIVGEAHLERSHRPHVHRVSVTDDDDTTTKISADTEVWTGSTFNRGLRLHVRNLLGAAPAGFTPSSALILDSTTTLAADTWYYVYLSHWKGLAPRTYTSGLVSRGVPVLSHIQPSALSTGNSAALNLPPPFGVAAIPAGEACCVAILRRNSANTGWRGLQGSGDYTRVSGDTGIVLTETGVFPGALTIAETQLPRARVIKMALHAAITFSAAAGVNASLKLEVLRAGTAVILANHRVPCPGIVGDTRWDFEFDVPYDAAGYDYEITAVNATMLGGGPANLYVVGWTF